LTFLGRAWSEPTLIRLAYAFERGTRHRRPPACVAGAPFGTGPSRAGHRGR
jgi:amidase